MPILTFLAAVASVQSPASPATVVNSPASSGPMIFDFRPGAVSCDGGSPTPLAVARPLPSVWTSTVGATPGPFRFIFRIDDDGRVLSIKPEVRAMGNAYVPTPDLQPALAASRFAAGSPQGRCTIQYDVDAIPLDRAPATLVRRYLALPHDGVYFESEVRKRARALDGDCYAGRGPTPLLRAYPDLDAVPQAPGTLSMTVAAFDLDDQGRPIRVRTLQSEGNTELDAATARAAADSRFKTDRVRTGCVLPMYRRQREPLAPPAALSLDGFRNTEGCPVVDRMWAHLPTLTFPQPFRRRGIEGWAIVRYDLAPWGQVGNVSIIASEPAAAFGEQARQIISNARHAPSARGASGCVERVRFKLPEGDGVYDATPVPPPPPPTG